MKTLFFSLLLTFIAWYACAIPYALICGFNSPVPRWYSLFGAVVAIGIIVIGVVWGISWLIKFHKEV